MTDKQIIIDGVDVLNCGHYSQFEGETENACYIMQKTFIGKEEISKEYCSCETNPNCYYKQLKTKEQECEEWKNKLAKSFADERKKEIVIDLLKAEVEKYKQLADSFEADFYNALSDKESNLLKKYKQALEEIREIQKDCEGCKGDCCYCYSGSGWVFKLSDGVLKGNFEVLDE